MTLATFISDISTELNTGTTVDAIIETKVRKAARTIEGLHNWEHMRKEEIITIFLGPSEATQPQG
ncbi:hypothetical protein LCGC14_2277930 [marine sediment metagenome]|uniref:Uncharacterized protein n=1 Tax=marine sediment metagenome TaxID=412755 RepID=A0A0F9F7F4_9ZZZZ